MKTRWMTLFAGSALAVALWSAPAYAEEKPKEEPKQEEPKKEAKAGNKTAKKDAKQEAPSDTAPKEQK